LAWSLQRVRFRSFPTRPGRVIGFVLIAVLSVATIILFVRAALDEPLFPDDDLLPPPKKGIPDEENAYALLTLAEEKLVQPAGGTVSAFVYYLKDPIKGARGFKEGPPGSEGFRSSPGAESGITTPGPSRH